MPLGRENPHPPLTERPFQPRPEVEPLDYGALGESLKSIGKASVGMIREQLGGAIQAAGELYKPDTLLEAALARKHKPGEKVAAIGKGIAESGKIDQELSGVDGSIELGIASGLALTPSIAANLIVPGSGLTVMLGQKVSQSYGRGREKLTPHQAGIYAGAHGVSELASEAMFKMPFLKAFESFGKDGFFGFLKWGAKEMSQELTAETMDAAIDKAALEPEMTLAEFTDRLFETAKTTPSALLTQRLAARGAVKALEGAKKLPEIIHKKAQTVYPTPRAKGDDVPIPRKIAQKTEGLEQPQAEAEEPFKPKLQTEHTFSPEEIVNAPIPEDIVPGMNLTKFESEQDVKNAIGLIAENDPEIQAARGEPRTWETSVAMGQALNLTPKKLQQMEGTVYNSGQMDAAVKLAVKSADHAVELAKEAVQSGSVDLLMAYQNAMQRHRMIQATFAKHRAEAARSVNIMKRVKKSMELSRQLGEFGDEGSATRDKMMDSARRVLQVAEKAGIEAASKQIAEEAKPTGLDRVIEVFINNLLSGPQTHMVNVGSGVLLQAAIAPEYALASGLGKILPRGKQADKVYMREVPHRVFAQVGGAIDGMTLAADVFIRDEAYDATTKVDMPRRHANPGLFGDIINLPTRALTAEDEWLKVVGYRQELRGLAVRKGMHNGLRGRELDRYVREQLVSPDLDVHLKSVQASRHYTFTEELGPWMKGFQNWAEQVPVLRMFTPFIRTPVNIVHTGTEYVLPMAAPNFWKNLANAGPKESVRIYTASYWKQVMKEGGANRDLALARAAIGQSLALATIALVEEGLLTGGGPEDPEERRVWRQNHQPYSALFFDKETGERQWRAFGRFEPPGLVIGAAADFAEMMGRLDKDDRYSWAALISTAFARNVTNKTFMQGMANLSDAISGRSDLSLNAMEKLGLDILGAAVPTFLAQQAREDDPYLRNIQVSGEGLSNWDIALGQIVNKWKSRLPGLSKDLPYSRGPWGEPIYLEPGYGGRWSPIFQKQAAEDWVNKELLENVGVFPSFLSRKIKGYELNEWQFSDLEKVVGKARRLAVETAMNDPDYWRKPRYEKQAIIQRALSEGTKAGKEVFLAWNLDVLRAATIKDAQEKVKDIREAYGK